LFVVRRASQALLVLLLGLAMAACSSGGGGRTGQQDAAPPAGTSPTKFSNPTGITNPLFPASRLEQLVYLGQDQGDPLRVEVTRLPGSKPIDLNGTQVPAVKMQFLATSGTTILEVATDYFAQADDGTVWYLGEHVDNYENGVVADHEGTWVTGEKRPDGKLFRPGVIMPARPQKGDVFFPENNKPFVFEKVTVAATGLTIPGPRGAVGGAIKTHEKLLDGTTEEKTFAPGYVEHTARVPFGSKKPEELVGVAIAIPIDKVDGPQPRELADLATTASGILTTIRSSDWTTAGEQLATITRLWEAHQAAIGEQVPKLVAQMRNAHTGLADAVAARDRTAAQQAAVRVARATADLQLRYEPVAAVDRGRLGAWAGQVLVDVDAKDEVGVREDAAVLDTIWARTRHAFTGSAGEATVDAELSALRAAARDKRLDAAGAAADKVRAALATL
jgi:hypothetical protein